MTKRSRQKHSKEFKLQAVELALSGETSQAQVARDLGINPVMLSRWVSEYNAAKAKAEEAFPGQGKLSPNEQKIKDLEAQLRRVTMERDILRKATAYFAKLPE